jgi:hypothetical protein
MDVHVDVFILIDADGDYSVGGGDEDVPEKFANEHGDLAPTPPSRLIKLVLTVPAPEAVELQAMLPAGCATEAPITLTVK